MKYIYEFITKYPLRCTEHQREIRNYSFICYFFIVEMHQEDLHINLPSPYLFQAWKVLALCVVAHCLFNNLIIRPKENKFSIVMMPLQASVPSSVTVRWGKRKRKIKGLRGVLKHRWYQVFPWDLCWGGRARISALLMKTSLFQQDRVASCSL